MLKYTEGDARINGVNIHYYRTGSNLPPFVLLHGMTDNGLCWTPVAELLAKKYEVIMPDAQGHGKSDRMNTQSGPADRPGPADHTGPMDQAHQTAGLIQKLGLKRPFIMGHSMGASCTLNVAVQYPDLPRAIILEDPGWFPEDMIVVSPEIQARQREVMLKHMKYKKMTQEELIAEGRKENPRWSDAEIEPWATAKTQFDPAIFTNMNFKQPSYTELVPQIRCPALLITADQGIVTTKIAEHAVQLSKTQKPLQWVHIKDSGHNIRREQFDQFWKALNDFLAEC